MVYLKINKLNKEIVGKILFLELFNDTGSLKYSFKILFDKTEQRIIEAVLALTAVVITFVFIYLLLKAENWRRKVPKDSDTIAVLSVNAVVKDSLDQDVDLLAPHTCDPDAVFRAYYNHEVPKLL